MSDHMASMTDCVRELRLRKWARQHFVLPELRKSTWHPVVLDEMRRRDQELSNESRLEMADVVPSGVEPTQMELIESAVSQTTLIRYEELNIGSRIVPLIPDRIWNHHPAALAIPKPHFRANETEALNIAELSQFAESY